METNFNKRSESPTLKNGIKEINPTIFRTV